MEKNLIQIEVLSLLGLNDSYGCGFVFGDVVWHEYVISQGLELKARKKALTECEGWIC